ncbi:unnamed protein product [Microthlaspi erraticum]|uniref:F-box domain-containing protein n=1 Tax=Microthlaspi erraticum TaxID=1685480 RepID=A0A6D2IWM2_9BRAS|nr:unnamed protein product [Microthlaspi erraticum]
MKRLKQQLYSDHIPDDLLIEIFSRLPRKSIDRFRCVSKSLGYILGRPDFRELFLTKSSTRPRILFTVASDGKLLFYSSPQPQNPDDNSTLVPTPYHTSFPHKFLSAYSPTVCGLALLNDFRKKKVKVICNPMTGEFLTLPTGLRKDKTLAQLKAKAFKKAKAKGFKKAKAKGFKKAKATGSAICLGYDPISKQFKVLCVRPNTHHVLTLESGKPLWRMIECQFHFKETYRMPGDICINGVLYSRAKLGQSAVMVCFDVGSEKFGFINLDKDVNGEPGEDDDDYYDARLALFNYKGKLGLCEVTVYRGTKTKDELVLWVLEDAANHKWSKLTYELPTSIRDQRFVGMTGTGDIVFYPFPRFFGVKIDCLYFYNLERKTVARVNIQGFEGSNNRSTFTTWRI